MISQIHMWKETDNYGVPGACLRAKSKYAGGGYGRGVPLPYIRKKSKYELNGGFSCISEPKHRLNCFQNKSEKQSKSYCFGSGLFQNRYLLKLEMNRG